MAKQTNTQLAALLFHLHEFYYPQLFEELFQLINFRSLNFVNAYTTLIDIRFQNFLLVCICYLSFGHFTY